MVEANISSLIFDVVDRKTERDLPVKFLIILSSAFQNLICFIMLHGRLIKTSSLHWIARSISTSPRSRVSISVCTSICWAAIACRDVYIMFLNVCF